MRRFRLRTKFLFSLLAITVGLTGGTLLTVRNRVSQQLRGEILDSLRNSVRTFQDLQRQRETTLERSARLLANLPSLKALMTTRDKLTIQDASSDFWRLGGSDLFLLADREGDIAALHTNSPDFNRETGQRLLHLSLVNYRSRDWWYGGGHLYEVFFQPIYFGSPTEVSSLGTLAVGYEIEDRMAREVGRIAGSEVAFIYDKNVVTSTLSIGQETELARQGFRDIGSGVAAPADVDLRGEHFLAESIVLASGTAPRVRLSVLKSFDRETLFLQKLNRVLLGLGLAAVLVGSALVYFLSHTFTRPLASLAASVRAMERGDFTLPLDFRGDDEVAQVSSALDRMRKSLKAAQDELLQAERLATIGRMASTVSHELRHPLTTILAYAEFLSEGKLDERQRQDLYREIRVAVDQMTDLIASLLELARLRETLRPVRADIGEIIRSAMRAVQARREFSQVQITLSGDSPAEGWFDAKKLERVFHNLLVNACEAVPHDSGRVEVQVKKIPEGVRVRVADNGPGIPEEIRSRLFEPFVSHGKENGTGLGLSVVQKIVQDHGGDVALETATTQGAAIVVTFPATLNEAKPASLGEAL